MHPLTVGLPATPAALPGGGVARWGPWAAAGLVLPLSWLAVEVARFGGEIALWWPAAGAGVIAVAAAPSRSRPLVALLVAVLAALGNYLGGREVSAAVPLGLANGIEALVGGAVLAYGVRGWPRLRTMEDLARLFTAALAASTTIAIFVASLGAGIYGDDWTRLAPAVLASHLASILVIAPVGMVLERKGHRAGPLETWLQSALLLLTIAAVLAPEQDIPLTFLLFPALVWGAVRLAPTAVVWQVFVTALGLTTATILDWGFLSSDWGLSREMTGLWLQATVVTIAAVALPLMVLRSHTVWAQGALESTDETLRNIMSATTATAVLGTDLRGTIEFFNVGAEELTGWDTQDVVGQATLALRTGPAGEQHLTIEPTDVDDRAQLLTLVQPFLENEATRSFSRDWDYLRKDGSTRTVSVRISKRYHEEQVVGFLGVAHDVTERRRQEDLTTAALDAEREVVERLEQVDRAKNDFMATVSHELRTPITSIMGYTELLLSDETGTLPTMHRQILSRVDRNGRRLMGLVEDVLTMSQIEVGTLRFRFRDVDLRTVVERAVETEVSVLGVAGVMLRQEVTDQLLPVSADPDKLERAVAALLDNAAKYSQPGDDVELELTADDSQAVLRVRDHGIGISQADQSKVFDRFFRSTEANERVIQGAGLGLTVTRAIVEGHYGTIGCESTLGEGATFTITLPLCLDQVAEPVMTQDRPLEAAPDAGLESVDEAVVPPEPSKAAGPATWVRSE